MDKFLVKRVEMKMRILIAPILMIILFALSACSESKTEKVVEYADDLQTAIEDFEDSRENAAENVTDITQDTVDELDNKKPDLRGVARSWEFGWKDVKSRFSVLENDFSTVATVSRSYFDQLDQLANNIGNAGIKASEKNKNTSLKASWTSTFKQAAQDIENLRKLISEGDDFHNVLLGASLREKLAENIEDLKNISKRAQSLLGDLEQLTIEGRKLTAS